MIVQWLSYVVVVDIYIYIKLSRDLSVLYAEMPLNVWNADEKSNENLIDVLIHVWEFYRLDNTGLKWWE